MREKIRILMIRPKERPRVCYIEPTIKAFKRVVNAKDIQAKRLESGAYVVFSKDRFLSDNTLNRQVGSSIIKGTMLIVAANDQRIPVSLTDDKVSKYSLRFWNIETFEEV